MTWEFCGVNCGVKYKYYILGAKIVLYIEIFDYCTQKWQLEVFKRFISRYKGKMRFTDHKSGKFDNKHVLDSPHSEHTLISW